MIRLDINNFITVIKKEEKVSAVKTIYKYRKNQKFSVDEQKGIQIDFKV
jgi:hypothetical protein